MKTRIALGLAALASALVLAPLAASAGDGNKQRVSFSKCNIPMPADAPPGTVFAVAGSTSGPVNGNLLVYGQPGALEPVGNRTYLEADYIVTATDGSGRSFTARVGGLWNTGDGTARAVLYGFVSDGWLRGAQVVDEFAGTAPGCVAGTLTLTPRWVPGDGE
jgi:hypothetical protein